MKPLHRKQAPPCRTYRFAAKWCALLLIASLPAHAIAEGASEHAVKAAIIFKIAKFVSWPQNAFEDNRDPLSVCVQKDDPISQALSALGGKPIHGRVLSVQFLDDTQMTFTNCQILFLTSTRGEQQIELLNSIADQPILTIGDTEQFISHGGIISLEIEQNRVRFAISVEASETAGLSISAQLLQLAKIVDSRQGT